MITLFIIYLTNADMKLVSYIYKKLNKYHDKRENNHATKI